MNAEAKTNPVIVELDMNAAKQAADHLSNTASSLFAQAAALRKNASDLEHRACALESIASTILSKVANETPEPAVLTVDSK